MRVLAWVAAGLCSFGAVWPSVSQAQTQTMTGDVPGQSAPVTADPAQTQVPEETPTPAAPGSASEAAQPTPEPAPGTTPEAPETAETPRPAAPGSGAATAETPEVDGAAARLTDESLLLDGHVRHGAFLAGPGSLNFILHHSILAGVGGLVTMGIASGFRLDESGAREAMLAGTLIGAGVGFGVSAWWQFNHWLDRPVATFGIVNSIVSGMAITGLFDLFTDDRSTLAWTALIGAELGAWLTVGMGGGEYPFRKGIAVASAAGWAAVYAALFVAIIGTTSGFPPSGQIVDTLLIAPGIGALGMALAGLRFDPSAAQVIRADLFGAGVGAGVLLLSALVLGGFATPLPYVLTLLASAGAITAVSVFWAEAAETQPKDRPGSGYYRDVLYRSPDKHKPYNNPWW